jgi:hypothetical protein
VNDPWAFGWTQLLTLFGFAITTLIAVGSYRTFARWKKEKLEEKRIEVALEALAIAYETKFIFNYIRNPLAYEIEWKNMPERKGESERDRSERGSYYAVLRRHRESREFFDRVWRLQPKFMAVFGADTEKIFDQFHNATEMVRMAANMLTWELPIKPAVPSEEDFNRRLQLRSDIWTSERRDDRITRQLDEFRERVERLCNPVVARGFSRQ